jgi:RNA polymerase sigma-70 factor (ECF subfamily)
VVVREEVRAVVRLLDNMRATDAEILRLAAWEGLNTAEIATVLDISPDAAKQRLSRARKRLSDMYEAQYEKTHIHNPSAQEGGVW